jgi:hypothetical protein
MTTYVKNDGILQVYTKKNNKKNMNELRWNGEYDGNIASLNLDINDNGKRKNIHMNLDNDDLLDILNRDVINQPLDQRLTQDFLLGNRDIKENSVNKKRYLTKTMRSLRVKSKTKSKPKSKTKTKSKTKKRK